MKRVILGVVLVAALLGCKSPATKESSSESPASAGPPVIVDQAAAGSISGVISFRGAPARAQSIDMTQDPGCPSQPQPTQVVVVNNGRLANVFVYVKDGLPQGRFPIPSEPVVLDQKGCRYVPHVLGIMAGQQLKILNTDTADHNVHDLPRNNPEWNESQSQSGPPVFKTFPRPEMMIPVQCNQHPWMKAYLNVMADPYFAVSAADGSFQIPNLPPGEYTIVAVHEKFGERSLKVKVSAKQETKVDFSFAAP